MKRIIPFISVILLILFGSSIALAATWEYKFPIFVTDTSNTTRTYYPVMLGFPANQLSSYINGNGLDTNMQIGDTDIKYMLVNSSNCTAVIPNLPAKATVQADLYTGYSPEKSSMAIVPGPGGYVTVVDDADIDPIDETEWEIVISQASLNMNNVGADLISKPNVLTANISDTTTVTVNMTGICNLAANNLSSGYSDIAIGATGNVSAQNTTGANEGGINTGAIWPGQSFTATDNFTLNAVLLKLKRQNTPGTVYLSLRNADANYLPTGANLTLGTYDGNTITTDANGDWYRFEMQPPFNVSKNNKYALVINVPNATVVGAHTVSFFYDGGGNPYNGGLRFSSNDNINFTAQAGGLADQIFKVLNAYKYIKVDGVLKDTDINTGNLTDNANNWVFMNSAVSSADNITITIDGTVQGWWEPNDIISGTTLPDRAGGDNPGTFTWGTNSNISLDYGGQESYQSMSANATATGGFDTPQAFMPATWFAMGENVEDLPFYDMVYGAISAMDFPDDTEGVQTIYFIVIVGIAITAFLGMVMFTRSAFVGFMSMIVVLFIGSSMTVVPMWIPFSVLLTGFGIMFLYRQVAY